MRADSRANLKKTAFSLMILGQTLEHLGVQMYKHRDAALAELVANAWDAGATRVDIDLPDPSEYKEPKACITIRDNGLGMTEQDIQNMYLVLGRNRRLEGKAESGREPMGRKGIGKLAGFGMAACMDILSWRNGRITKLSLKASELGAKPGEALAAQIPGEVYDTPTGYSANGTEVILRDLKHASGLSADTLRSSLARRFGRLVRGKMRVFVDGEELGDPYQDFAMEHREPESDFQTVTLSDGNTVNYFYATTEKSLGHHAELKGFSILVRGRVAQAPPFFFDVEGTATGQHGTRYVYGEIEADFLDDSVDEEDVISTDRQQIDWESPKTAALKTWGQELARRTLREWRDRQGDKALSDLEMDEKLRSRIGKLDRPSRKQAEKVIRVLGQSSAEPEKLKVLAGRILTAYEYGQFHDFAAELEKLGDDPEKLQETIDRFHEWRVLESRAILEVIKGRIGVVEKFFTMVVNNNPETASKLEKDNLHDLLAEFPWLINPEWQILAEEKKITKQLREWHAKEPEDGEPKDRFDFLGLSDNNQVVVIEIKRPGHPVRYEELQRLQRYRRALLKGHQNTVGLLIGGSFDFEIEEEKTAPIFFATWAELYEKARAFYHHYQALLESDVENPDFGKKEIEVKRARSVIEKGAHRPPDVRKKQGLGVQDTAFQNFTPDPSRAAAAPPKHQNPTGRPSGRRRKKRKK